MIVYPKKTQLSKTTMEIISNYASRFGRWITRKKKAGGSKEEQEFVPMSFSEMSVFCLRSYLEEYKTIVCEGKLQQGTNTIEIVDSVIHVLNSLTSFAIRTQGYFAHVIDLEVSDKNKYKRVCEATIDYTPCCDNRYSTGNKGMVNFVVEGTRRQPPSGARKATYCCCLHPCVPGKDV